MLLIDSTSGPGVRRGRTFRPGDDGVVIVGERMAGALWPGLDPVGRSMTAGGMDDWWQQEKWATVIGVVADIRQRDLTRPPEATYYFAPAQRPYRTWSMSLVIEGRGFGHGVGMAQDGAYWMGRAGASTEEILGHFYPGTGIGRATGSVRVAVHTTPARYASASASRVVVNFMAVLSYRIGSSEGVLTRKEAARGCGSLH